MDRVFIALELPENVRRQLAELCSGLKDVRWVEEHNFHLTLAFIGEIERPALYELNASLSEVRFDPFDLYLSQVDCFESRGRVKAVWAGVEGARDALSHLQHKIVGAIEAAGLVPERRKYKPHVTLAWLKSSPKDKVLTYMSANNRFKTPEFRINYFSLYRSHLTRHGPDYEVLEQYGLIDET